MNALERAKQANDKQYLKLVEVYGKVKDNQITKSQAIEILGTKLKRTVEMWDFKF